MKKYLLILGGGLVACSQLTTTQVSPQSPSVELSSETENQSSVARVDRPRYQPVSYDYAFQSLVPAADVPFTTITVDPQKGISKRLPTGTIIKIESNALVDQNGRVVKDPVELKFREFHKSEEILASGIPMQYADGNFESAGMFQIEASLNNEPMYLAKGKPAKVFLSSNVDAQDAGYENFRLVSGGDSLGDSWKQISAVKQQKNKNKIRKVNELNDDLTEGRMFQLQYDLENYPALEPMKDQWYEYAGGFDLQNPWSKDNRWVLEHQWQSLDVEKSRFAPALSYSSSNVIDSAFWSPKGSYILAKMGGRELLLLSSNGKKIVSKELKTELVSVSMNAEESRVLLGAREGQVIVLDKKGKVKFSKTLEGGIKSVGFFGEDKLLVQLTWGIRVFKLNGEELEINKLLTARTQASYGCPDGEVVLCAEGRKVFHYDVNAKTKRPITAPYFSLKQGLIPLWKGTKVGYFGSDGKIHIATASSRSNHVTFGGSNLVDMRADHKASRLLVQRSTAKNSFSSFDPFGYGRFDFSNHGSEIRGGDVWGGNQLVLVNTTRGISLMIPKEEKMETIENTQAKSAVFSWDGSKILAVHDNQLVVYETGRGRNGKSPYTLRRLNLRSESNEFSTLVRVYDIDSLFASRIGKYEATIEAELAERRAIVEQQGDFLNGFVAASFGVYNCDRLIQQSDGPVFTLNFDPTNKWKGVPLKLYQLTGENSTGVIVYQSLTIKEFRPPKGTGNAFFVVLPDNKVGVVDSRSFAKKALVASTGSKLSLPLKIYDAPLNASALREMLM